MVLKRRRRFNSEVAPLAQMMYGYAVMMLPSANDVRLRRNDVAPMAQMKVAFCPSAKSIPIENGIANPLRHSEVLTSYFESVRANLAVFPQKNGA
jgi:hypothetical protein